MIKKRKIIVVLSIVVLLLLMICFVNFKLILEDIEVWIWGESTFYAPEYKENAFWKIRKGMSESEVLSMLGPPLDKSGDNNEYWHYSDQKKSNYRIRTIIFGKNGKVIDKETFLYID